MIRILVALVWIGLILATALTRQVLANWLLSLALAAYLLLRWRSHRARIASSRGLSRRTVLPSSVSAVQPRVPYSRQPGRVPGLAEHKGHPSARWR